MARTSPDLVKGVLGPNYNGVSALDMFIEMGNVSTNDAAAEAAKRGAPYDDQRARLIETNLAAYYYCIMDPLFLSKATNGSSGSWAARSYMDAAKNLDPSGSVEFTMNGQRVGAKWLGKSCRR